MFFHFFLDFYVCCFFEASCISRIVLPFDAEALSRVVRPSNHGFSPPTASTYHGEAVCLVNLFLPKCQIPRRKPGLCAMRRGNSVIGDGAMRCLEWERQGKASPRGCGSRFPAIGRERGKGTLCGCGVAWRHGFGYKDTQKSAFVKCFWKKSDKLPKFQFQCLVNISRIDGDYRRDFLVDSFDNRRVCQIKAHIVQYSQRVEMHIALDLLCKDILFVAINDGDMTIRLFGYIFLKPKPCFLDTAETGIHRNDDKAMLFVGNGHAVHFQGLTEAVGFF